MRVIFISWSTIGGSGISQRQLANVLAGFGHEIRFIVFDKTPRKFERLLYEQLSDLSVRLGSSGPSRLITFVRDTLGQRSRRSDIDGLRHDHSAIPQNTLAAVMREDHVDAVVASSVDRWAWTRIQEVARRHGVPTILYVREESSLQHLATGVHPDALVANTPALAEALRKEGLECAMIPSVIDVSPTKTTSSREAALAINPIDIKGSDLLWALAERLPQVRFIVQESWPLDESQLAEISSRLPDLPNVDFRRRQPPGPDLYGEARVLLAPYLVNSRPRVVLEAQANGIPVLASDLPALREAVGPGGICLPLGDVELWVEKLDELWRDDLNYNQLSDVARAYSTRPEVDPNAIGREFEDLLLALTRRIG